MSVHKKVVLQGMMAFIVLCFFGSCEELIDLDIDDASPQIVIEANLSNGGPSYVQIMQSTSLKGDPRDAHVQEPAEVRVVRDDGLVIPFFPVTTPGMYIMLPTDPLANPLVENHQYTLYVDIGDKQYTAQDYMHPYIEVDSTGTGVRTIFNDDIHYASFRYQDPIGEENYYRYDVSINNGNYIFNSVLNDRFNDGLKVVHEVLSPEENLSTGDVMTVRRFVISKAVYQYWNDIQSVNPGSLAPANPRSNITNGALGYFSVNTSRIYEFTIQRFSLPEPEDVDDED